MRVGGRYELLTELGEGGIAQVHRARDSVEGREVALKRLVDHVAEDRHVAALFRREYHTLRRLEHPAIVTAYEWGIDDKGPFYTMELVEGQDLAQRGRMPYRDACLVIRDVASALALVHVQKLLHRDLTPSNVRVTLEGRGKLIDFGALCTAGTVPTHIVGTPAYSAPEAHFSRPLDHRADLFGLGALLYFALTGRPAFGLKHFGELDTAPAPPPPSALAPDVPRALDELVLALLARDPLSRPASAVHVIEALTRIAELDALSSTSISHGYLSSAAIVGRSRQLSVLDREFATIERQGGRTLVIEAPSGLGKSRLTQEAVLRAKIAGLRVVRVDASLELGPYGVLDRMLDALAIELPDEALTAELAEAAADVLGRSAALRDRWSELGRAIEAPAPIEDAAEERQRLVRGFVRFFETVSTERPLMLVSDDIQRLDDASLAVFGALASTEGHCVGQVLAQRTDEPARAPVPLRQLRRHARQLRLHRLSEADMSALVQACFGQLDRSASFARWLKRHSDGSPMVATAILQDLVDRSVIKNDGGLWVLPVSPPADAGGTLAELVERRISSLSEAAQQIAGLLAVSAQRLPLDEVAELADMPVASLLPMLDELSSAEVLTSDDRGYGFRHDSLREASLRRLAPEERRSMNQAVADQLLRLPLAAPEKLVAGFHLRAAGELARAAPLLAEGGQHMLREGATQDALRGLRAAIDIYDVMPGHRPRALRLRRHLCEAALSADRKTLMEYGLPTVEVLKEQAGISRFLRWRRRVGSFLALPLAMLWTALGAMRDPDRLSVPEAMEHLAWTITWMYGSASSACDVVLMRSLLESLEVFEHPLLRRTEGAVLYYHLRAQRLFTEGDWVESAESSKRCSELNEVLTPDGIGKQQLRAAPIVAHAPHVPWAMGGRARWQQSFASLCELQLATLTTFGRVINRFCHQTRGDLAEAELMRREHELDVIRGGANVHIDMIWHEIALYLIAQRDDVVMLRQLGTELNGLDRWAKWSDCYDGWAQPFLEALEAFFVDDDPAAALEPLERAETYLDELGTYLRSSYGYTLELKARCWLRLDRAEAVLGLRPALLTIEQKGHQFEGIRLRTRLALAHAQRAEPELALQEIDRARADAEAFDNPALDGFIAEQEAEVACLLAMEERVDAAVQRIEASYAQCDEPALRSRVESWLVRTTGQERLAQSAVVDRSDDEGVAHTLKVRQVSAPSQTDKILNAVMDETIPERAFILSEREGALTVLSSNSDESPPEEIQAVLRDWWTSAERTAETLDAPDEWQLVVLESSASIWGVVALERPALSVSPALFESLHSLISERRMAAGGGRRARQVRPASEQRA